MIVEVRPFLLGVRPIAVVIEMEVAVRLTVDDALSGIDTIACPADADATGSGSGDDRGVTMRQSDLQNAPECRPLP